MPDQKDKLISIANALASLEGNEGWAVFEGWIKEAIERSKEEVFLPKKVKNWNDYLHYRDTHNAYVKLLHLKDTGIRKGLSAKEAKDEQDA